VASIAPLIVASSALAPLPRYDKHAAMCGKALNFPIGGAAAATERAPGPKASRHVRHGQAKRPPTGTLGPRSGARGSVDRETAGLAAESEALARWTAALDKIEGAQDGARKRKPYAQLSPSNQLRARASRGYYAHHSRGGSDGGGDDGDDDNGDDGGEAHAGMDRQYTQRTQSEDEAEAESDQAAAADLLALCGRFRTSSQTPAGTPRAGIKMQQGNNVVLCCWKHAFRYVTSSTMPTSHVFPCLFCQASRPCRTGPSSRRWPRWAA